MLSIATVVVPTLGRPSLLRTLAPLVGRVPVIVVDDRRPLPGGNRPGGQVAGPLRAADSAAPLTVPAGVLVLRSGGRGPAAARNVGFRAATTEWVAFLDDDVEPPDTWVDDLAADLAAAARPVGGVQGRIVVPTPDRPDDWQRSTKGLEVAVWATADLAYRRTALEQCGGFDERFPRAYREDADLGLRISSGGWSITTGRRSVVHPVRPGRWTQSIRSQRGNADDVLMRALHGPDWRSRAQVPRGRRRWHLVTTGCLLGAVIPRLRPYAGIGWLVLTADLARRRITPGPRTPAEVAAMTATSAVLPLAASWHWAAGWLRLRRLLAAPGPVVGGEQRTAA